jgi:hypothetical protein
MQHSYDSSGGGATDVLSPLSFSTGDNPQLNTNEPALYLVKVKR